MDSFSPLNEEEGAVLLHQSRPTTCPLDPIPTTLLQSISPTIVPAITHVFKDSLNLSYIIQKRLGWEGSCGASGSSPEP